MRKKNIWIMGITGLGNRFHDNSVCLVKNGKVVFAGSEERYTRIKHDASFPKNALTAALKFAGIRKREISIYATGWPKFSPLKTLIKIDKYIEMLENLWREFEKCWKNQRYL